MPGIVCVYPFGLGREGWKIARFIYYGLLALQHRGEGSCAIATLGRELRLVQGNGLINEVFDEDSLNSLEGFIGAGMVSPLQERPVVVDASRRLILFWDGMPALERSRDRAWKAFGELLSDEISRVGDSLRATVKIVEEVDGGYSFIALTEEQEVLIARDKHGVKPLEVGSLGFDLGAVASETSALDVLGMEHSYTVQPGEVLRFDPFSVERAFTRSRGTPRYCSFEYVYLARPDSLINGVSVYSVRERVGEALAGEVSLDADVVIGVPETAIPFAMGYSKASGIPASLGFITTGKRTRTALKPSPFERLVGVQLKLNPIRSVVEGRDIVLIDDSVVRGTTLRNTVWNLKRRGARRVHVLIGSPPLCSQCPYGEEVPPPDELIARSLSDSEIAEIVGADTFHFLSVEGLVKSVGLQYNSLCLKCWGDSS